ncbi:rhodanese-like domain-containing protein [Methanobacterium spitsbergense]|uniref:Rhodanese-like domain-containing protein n=1 Tax=Methanobacterium spitsbergense TaxID=2874285 RepID=A0A8T5UX90_9EURY|nr:rhodanese-like domain-containing protein [Methanobacterium spitsbergense]MBZ2166526.1 rhodanese-like domain-containing protein [Methanobacterium spitsbergense]
MFTLRRNNKNDIEPKEAFELIITNNNTDGFVILDVRTPEEYNETHIENSLNINYNSKNFKLEIEKLDKNKKYLVYCHSGRRSSNAIKTMEKSGFKDLKNISGGISRWKKNNLPLI